MRVTIAIDDLSLPLPQMRRPDIRERLLNQFCRRWPTMASTMSISSSRPRSIGA